MVIGIFFQILGFVFYVFFNDMYQGFYLPSLSGSGEEFHYIELDQVSLNWMMFMKVLFVIFMTIQAKGGLDIVNPLTKEYREAQRGASNGIQMTERKSKKMHRHMNVVKGITCFMFLTTFICVPLFKGFCHQLVGDLVDVYYQDI